MFFPFFQRNSKEKELVFEDDSKRFSQFQTTFKGFCQFYDFIDPLCYGSDLNIASSLTPRLLLCWGTRRSWWKKKVSSDGSLSSLQHSIVSFVLFWVDNEERRKSLF